MSETTPGPSPPPGAPDADPPCRRFTLNDAGVLIVVATVWLTFLRSVVSLFGSGWSELRRQGSTPWSRPELWHAWGMLLVGALWLGLVFLTPAYLVLRLRDPRPPLRRLIWQPGMMACLLICAAFVPLRLLVNGLWSVVVLAGTVALAWLSAWWGGRLRPEPGWIDRLGRSLGAGWIAVAGCYLVLRAWGG